MNTLAAPVLLGMMLNEAALPPLQSFIDGPSTVFWVAVTKKVAESRQNEYTPDKPLRSSSSYL